MQHIQLKYSVIRCLVMSTLCFENVVLFLQLTLDVHAIGALVHASLPPTVLLPP